jgi:hypothetical protein
MFYLGLLGGFTVGPDLPPGSPGTLLSSPLGFFWEASGGVAPDRVAAGPDLLPGNPGAPGLEAPPVPGGF